LQRRQRSIRFDTNTRFTELALFEALVSFIVAHAALSTQGTSEYSVVIFYVIILAMNLIALILLYLYGDIKQFVEYNENMAPSAFVWVLGGLIAVFFVAVIITSQYKTTSIFVPNFTISGIAAVGLTSIMWSVLYNVGLVANAEETTKLVGINAIYMYLNDNFEGLGETTIKAIAVGVPVGFWALLHAYVAYVGPLMWPLVASAFVAGIILFVVMYKTRSLLAAILVHGLYNALVLAGTSMGWLNLSQSNTMLMVQPVYLVGLQVMSLTLILLNRKKHTLCAKECTESVH